MTAPIKKKRKQIEKDIKGEFALVFERWKAAK